MRADKLRRAIRNLRIRAIRKNRDEVTEIACNDFLDSISDAVDDDSFPLTDVLETLLADYKHAMGCDESAGTKRSKK